MNRLLVFDLGYRRPSWHIDESTLDLWCPADRRWVPTTCSCSYEPDVSVVTAVIDRPASLRRAIESLNAQDTDARLEHVIVDGSETRAHQELIEQVSRTHTTYAWNQDESLYDAFNLGWRITRGEFVAYLNSDDWYEPNFVRASLSALELSGADWSFGDVTFHDDRGPTTMIPGQPAYALNSWSNFSRFHHTTVLARKRMFDVVGDFPETFGFSLGKWRKTFPLQLCSDFGWFLVAQASGFVGVWTPEVMGHMSTGGASSSHRRGREIVHLEAPAIAATVFPEHRWRILSAWTGRYVYTTMSSTGHAGRGVTALSYRMLRGTYQMMISRV